VALLAIAGGAFAGESNKDTRADATEAVRHIDFTAVDVTATRDAPHIKWIRVNPKVTFNPLIRPRATWTAEMKASLDEVK